MFKRLSPIGLNVMTSLSLIVALSSCSKSDSPLEKLANIIPTAPPQATSTPLPSATKVPPPATVVTCNASLPATTPAPTLTAVNSSLTYGSTEAMQVSGGSAPYFWNILSGNGAVSTSGVFRAVGGGASVVEVKDASCRSATFTMNSTQATMSAINVNDPVYSQAGVNTYFQTQTKMKYAWSIKYNCSNTLVGVIDTGVDYTHPDLAEQIYLSTKETPGDGIDNDLNGYVDDTKGWNFGDDNNDPKDQTYHGTHVAGIIGAKGNNGVGVSGVCWQSKILPLRVEDSLGVIYSSAIVESIHYGINAGVKIFNISLGTSSSSLSIRNAITLAEGYQILVVAAAGNDTEDIDISPMYPAAFTNANIISVASSNSLDGMSYFSNYGVKGVDLAAPGSDIWSTVPVIKTFAMNSDGVAASYAKLSGTSMSAPHVAGGAALLWSLAPELSMAQVKARILLGVDPIASMSGDTLTGGRSNLQKLLDPTQ